MNTLESVTVSSPVGKDEECASFIIDDSSTPFVLNDITIIGEKYTFSAWFRSETQGNITVNGEMFSTNTEWQRYVTSFSATSDDLVVAFENNNTYYIYHPKLETGNIATDWTPAPEDIDDNIENVNSSIMEVIHEEHTDIIAESSAIILSALETYVKTSDYESFKTSVETQLSVMAGEISMNFTSTTEQIESVDNDLQTKFETVYKHIQFNEDGITISAGDNALALTLDNDMISFSKNGTQFGWWDGIDFHTGNIVVDVNERAKFGNFAFVPRSDGSLMFVKVNS